VTGDGVATCLTATNCDGYSERIGRTLCAARRVQGWGWAASWCAVRRYADCDAQRLVGLRLLY